nr:NAD(P)-binding protein [Streptomyces boluensis]
MSMGSAGTPGGAERAPAPADQDQDQDQDQDLDRGRPRTAVIGSGVAGLTAAHVLARAHHVTLYEADGRLGGHAHTHDLTAPDGRHTTSASSRRCPRSTGPRAGCSRRMPK